MSLKEDIFDQPQSKSQFHSVPQKRDHAYINS
jgi:hypothetical protein